MVANADRGEIEYRLGGHARLLVFRSEAVIALGKQLEKDPLLYFAQGGEQTNFCVQAILCGSQHDKRGRRDLTPGTVYAWIDDDDDFDRESFCKAVLYAIARGKRGDESKRMIKVLEEVFGALEGAAEDPPKVG